jgi:7-cyano-7-deazaguanine synthase in queuosine biosynthesis
MAGQAMSREFTVVVNDCVSPALPNIRYVRSRSTAQDEQNYRVVFDHLVDGLPNRLTDRQLDWLNLLSWIFAADMICDRGEGDLDWSRSISLFVPVRDPDHWSRLSASIQDIFGALTDDRLQLHFIEETAPGDPPRTRKKPFPQVEGVALLSGGMDSFVGALQLLDAQQLPFLFVSHSSSGAATQSQTSVRKVLKALSPGSEYPSFTAQKQQNFPGNEQSQRSRSMLYMGAAATVAAALGVDTVYLNENGVLALHLPMSEARIGSYSTRTASPHVLDDMEALASAALGCTIKFSNILLQMTKPEVAALGANLGQADALKDTISCWSAGRTRRHCGYCAPCIMRRISCELHGLDDAEYENDIFTDEVLVDTNPRAKDNLVHLGGLIRDFRELDDFDLELEYVEIFSGGSQITAAEGLELHKRWANEAHTVLSKYPLTARYI